jgi:hypothetical protein
LDHLLTALLVACRFYIAMHPEVEAKITAELASRNLLATPDNKTPRPLEHDDLSELTYLGAAIKVHLAGPCVSIVTEPLRSFGKKDCIMGI